MRSALPASACLQDRDRLIAGQHIGQVAVVDDIGDLLRRHLRDQLPDRLAGLLGEQVPDGVDDGAGREMDRALLRPDPAQLAVAGEMPPEACREGRRTSASSVPTTRCAHRLDRHAADVVAAADGEGEAVAGQTALSVSRMT